MSSRKEGPSLWERFKAWLELAKIIRGTLKLIVALMALYGGYGAVQVHSLAGKLATASAKIDHLEKNPLTIAVRGPRGRPGKDGKPGGIIYKDVPVKTINQIVDKRLEQYNREHKIE